MGVPWVVWLGAFLLAGWQVVVGVIILHCLRHPPTSACNHTYAYLQEPVTGEEVWHCTQCGKELPL
jgi:hypothetical protein